MVARRQFVIALAAGAFAPRVTFAQLKGRIWRIGFFYNGSRQSSVDTGRYRAFLRGMRDLGYLEGRDFVVDERFVADWDSKRLSDAAAALIKSNVDVIVATGGPTVHALKQAATSIPVVAALVTDPVANGLAASLAHPGGNFTGVSPLLDQISPKHIEFIKLVAPKISRIAVLAKKGSATNAQLRKRIEADAAKGGLEVIHADIDLQGDIDPAISKMAQQHAGAFIILGDSFFVQHARQIADAAKRYRLPSIYTGAEYPEAGGLMSYGPDFPDSYRRAATYVDKILKGAKPGDLPFEQPTQFFLTINSKTVKLLGIELSNELVLRADKVIK